MKYILIKKKECTVIIPKLLAAKKLNVCKQKQAELVRCIVIAKSITLCCLQIAKVRACWILETVMQKMMENVSFYFLIFENLFIHSF